MEKYLTEKARPGKAVRLLENLTLMLLMGLLALCIWFLVATAMTAYELRMFNLKLLLPVIPVVLVALLMNPVTERIRARHHARVIVQALLASDGRIPADEVDNRTGMRRGADYALQLVQKGYMRDVRLVRGFLCLAEAADDIPPAEEVKPLFRDVEV